MSDVTRKEEQILLAIHFLKDEASLMKIRDRIQEFTGKNYSAGTVYAPLNRLFLNGYLESSLTRVPGSKKPVRYYRLTPDGYGALEEIRRMTREMWEGFTNPIAEKG
jgi:DNA-binding PadR family transcriptional regulator